MEVSDITVRTWAATTTTEFKKFSCKNSKLFYFLLKFLTATFLRPYHSGGGGGCPGADCDVQHLHPRSWLGVQQGRPGVEQQRHPPRGRPQVKRGEGGWDFGTKEQVFSGVGVGMAKGAVGIWVLGGVDMMFV